MSAVGNFFSGMLGLQSAGPMSPGGMAGAAMGAGNNSSSNGPMLGKFDADMQAELGEMLKQELRQMKENRQMDELKHKGKLHSDAGAIAP
jgi:hypothetical protein